MGTPSLVVMRVTYTMVMPHNTPSQKAVAQSNNHPLLPMLLQGIEPVLVLLGFAPSCRLGPTRLPLGLCRNSLGSGGWGHALLSRSTGGHIGVISANNPLARAGHMAEPFTEKVKYMPSTMTQPSPTSIGQGSVCVCARAFVRVGCRHRYEGSELFLRSTRVMERRGKIFHLERSCKQRHGSECEPNVQGQPGRHLPPKPK